MLSLIGEPAKIDIREESPDFAHLLTKSGGSIIIAKNDVLNTRERGESFASARSLSDNLGQLKGSEFYVISENLIRSKFNIRNV